MSLLATLASILTVAAAAAAPCNPIPGWEQVLADEKVRIVVLGEMHGTNEMPALFADAVCLTAQARPVVVALEQPSVDQAAVDAFLASDGGDEARRAFLGAQMWRGPMKDGRSSQAYFRLFQELRLMRAAGQIESVILFQPWSFTEPPTPEQYEQAMADLVNGGTASGATVVALVGNVHALLTPVPWEPRYKPMAAHLPPGEVATFNLLGQGGEAWVCRVGPDDCGVKPMGNPPTSHARGAELGPVQGGAYSGVIYLGGATTASPPQAVPQ